MKKEQLDPAVLELARRLRNEAVPLREIAVWPPAGPKLYAAFLTRCAALASLLVGSPSGDAARALQQLILLGRQNSERDFNAPARSLGQKKASRYQLVRALHQNA